MQDNASNVLIYPDVELEGKHIYPIGQVAAHFDLTIRAVRFYCELGLIKECARRGQRHFDINNIKRLSLVQKAKFLGFSLQEIATMIVDDRTKPQGVVLVIPNGRIEQEIKAVETRRDKLISQLQALSGCTSSIAA